MQDYTVLRLCAGIPTVSSVTNEHHPKLGIPFLILQHLIIHVETDDF